MRDRVNYSSGAIWEEQAGYSRAVRVGNIVEVSGTVASDESGQVHGLNDATAQTVFILEKIESALVAAGASLQDVVRTRIYVTDISRFEEIAAAHARFFRDIRPCTSMVEVSRLVGPGYLIEIEATAILSEKD